MTRPNSYRRNPFAPRVSRSEHITRRERAGMELLYNPVTKDRYHDAFEHSAECDGHFSKLSDVSGGEAHPARCACWCHSITLDKHSPPEYIQDVELIAWTDPVATSAPNEAPQDLIEPELEEHEIAVCELCGDPMSKCECVE